MKIQYEIGKHQDLAKIDILKLKFLYYMVPSLK